MDYMPPGVIAALCRPDGEKCGKEKKKERE
jgi:hypothetical protein